MMAQYATATELAGYLHKDLDTYSANQALTLVSAEFARVAGVPFTPTTLTYTTTGKSSTTLTLPYRQVTAVSEVRLNGVVITGVTLYGGRYLYRALGFGDANAVPSDTIDIDLIYGFATAPDDVKAGVLESAALVYESPLPIRSETIGATSITYAGDNIGGPRLTVGAEQTALSYRIPVIA